MTNLPRNQTHEADLHEDLRNELVAKLVNMTLPELQVVLAFIEQVVTCHDPDVVADFLHWRNDPRLASILQLAASISDELRDQLLFVAEEYYTSEHTPDA